MPVSRIIDNRIVSEAEFESRMPDIVTFMKQRASETTKPLALSRGRELAATAPAASDIISGLTPIGPGLPLTIKIEHVFTGEFPSRGTFGHRGDIAIFSGVKNFASTDASARAVNYLEPGVMPHTHFEAPTAFNQGTPVILYSPAVTDTQFTFSLEIAAANDFARELLDHLSGAFQSLAGIPVLLPFAGYLLGAGSLLKLGEGLADVLYRNDSSFLRTEIIRLAGPGTPTVAGLRIVHNSALDITGFEYQEGVGLVGKDGKPFDGSEPYIVISLDGARNDNLKGFTPAVATAAQLQKFLSAKDGAIVGIDTLVGALSLFSDLKYRQQAEKLQAEINDASTPPGDKPNLQKELDAIVKNIQESALKPK